MKSSTLLITCAATSLLAALSSTVVAQTPSVATSNKEAAAPVLLPSGKEKRSDKEPQGWSYALSLAANLNVTSNRDVVGQVSGNAFLLGASALAGVNYLRDKHEWLNSGTLNEAWSRTPTIDRFIKSNDLLELQSLYNYFLYDWNGPFVRASLQTGILKTERVTPQVVTYTNADDATEVVTTSNLRLSDSFQPLTINETLGWFIEPVRSEQLSLYARTGFGGRHTLADGVRTVSGDAVGAMATYTVLSDVHQAGIELFAGIDGKELEGRLLYNLGVTTLFPLINNDDADRSTLKLTRVALAGNVGMGVFSWMSINYQLKVVRDPQLVEDIQVQNALLLSFQYTLATPPPEKAETEPVPIPEEAQARISELEQRAQAAELRAAEAEARARAATAPPVEPLPVEPPATPVE